MISQCTPPGPSYSWIIQSSSPGVSRARPDWQYLYYAALPIYNMYAHVSQCFIQGPSLFLPHPLHLMCVVQLRVDFTSLTRSFLLLHPLQWQQGWCCTPLILFYIYFIFYLYCLLGQHPMSTQHAVYLLNLVQYLQFCLDLYMVHRWGLKLGAFHKASGFHGGPALCHLLCSCSQHSEWAGLRFSHHFVELPCVCPTYLTGVWKLHGLSAGFLSDLAALCRSPYSSLCWGAYFGEHTGSACTVSSLTGMLDTLGSQPFLILCRSCSGVRVQSQLNGGGTSVCMSDYAMSFLNFEDGHGQVDLPQAVNLGEVANHSADHFCTSSCILGRLLTFPLGPSSWCSIGKSSPHARSLPATFLCTHYAMPMANPLPTDSGCPIQLVLWNHLHIIPVPT